ncbi:MAG: chemotaxis-specific protein-glutamate methyltransferase CheB [Mariprofundales bacterium]|nr:chemotaxis-specific protein-glutamate methyltransferase CheB [Mariprofundales bacterium]
MAKWPCRVLIVDDSALMRRSVKAILEKSSKIAVVGAARDGVDALAKVAELKPDLVTLDINMPNMDGLTCLAHLKEEYPEVTVVMVSSLTDEGASATLEAIELGAIGYVAKPGTMSSRLSQVEDEILETVLGGHEMACQPSRKRRRRAAPPAVVEAPPVRTRAATSFDKLLIIGISTGGPATIMDVLPELPADYPYPVILVQHMPAAFTAPFAERLDKHCALTVRESSNSMPLEVGTVTVVHGGVNAEVHQERVGRYHIRHRKADPKAFFYIPNIDFTIQTATRALSPERIIAVIMTGIGDDGAKAAHFVDTHGGVALAEAEETSVVYGMPKALADLGCSHVEPSYRMTRRILRVSR